MIRPTLLPATDRTPTPWKNGGGVTSEVAVHPAGAGMNDFLWRVSIADVAEPGAFSTFPEIDRVLAVIEGQLRLGVDGQQVRLSPETPAHAFPGDVDAFGEPLGGPVRDLNLMVRRGAWRGSTEIVPPSDHVAIEPRAEQVLIVAIDTAKIVAGETFTLR